MNQFAVATWAVLLLGGPLAAGEAACDKSGCCAGKVEASKLIDAWKAAAEETRKLPGDERARIESRLAGLARECPIGSRVAPTLWVAHETLGSAVAFMEAHEKACPVASGKEAAPSEPMKKGAELIAARSKLLRELHQLSGLAVAALPPAPESSTSVLTAAPAASAAKDCCLAQKARVDALRASWQKAPEEIARLSESKRKELMASRSALAGSYKPAGLFPATFQALASGFDALVESGSKLDEWAKANPEVMKDVSEEAKKAFEGQNAMIKDVRDVLAQGRKAAGSSCGDCGGKAASTKA